MVRHDLPLEVIQRSVLLVLNRHSALIIESLTRYNWYFDVHHFALRLDWHREDNVSSSFDRDRWRRHRHVIGLLLCRLIADSLISLTESTAAQERVIIH